MRPARHQAAYRALLRLYPRSFRREYGADMAQLFGDRLHDSGWGAWVEAAPDLARTVPVLRTEAAMARLSYTARVLALVAVMAGAVAVSVGFGAGAAPVVIVIAAVAGLVALVAQRGVVAAAFGPRAPLWPSVTQAWWAPLAAVLGVAMLVFGVGTALEAHNWGGRVFGSSIVLAFGAAMLLGLMRRPFDRVAGNSMILLATVPAFPLFWLVVPAALALTVWIGVLAAGFGDDLGAEPLPGHQ